MENFMRKILRPFLFTCATLVVAMLSITQAMADLGGFNFVTKFEKKAVLKCDHIEYALHIETRPGPFIVPITVTDNWPLGTLPATSVNFTGTPSVVPTQSMTSSGWKVVFPTPVNGGAYDVAWSSPIDPTQFSGGLMSVKNQATLSQPGIKDLPSQDLVKGQSATIIDVNQKDYESCKNQNGGNGGPVLTPSCLDGKADVVCGKVLGTYDIIIHPNGLGGVIPTSVTITPVTGGIALSPAQSSYPVIGGVVQVTVLGAHPGDILSFDVSGTTAGGGSAAGTDLCCNGTIKIEIPKDLPCEPLIPVDLSIKKTGGTTPAPEVGAYSFNLAVTNEGAAFTAPPGTLTVTDVVPAGMQFNAVTGSGWTCTPGGVLPAGTTVTCHNNAAVSLPAGPGAPVVAISINATALGKMPFPPFTNCADVGLNPTSGYADSVSPNNHSCVTVIKGGDLPPHVELEKKCEPAVLGKGDFVAPKYEAICHINVKTWGNITTPITFNEAFFGAGHVNYMGSSDPWACSPPSVTSPAPIHCSIAGGTFAGPTNTSTVDFKVVLNSAADGNGKLNCVTGNFNGHGLERSCTPIIIKQGEVIVEKTCGPVSIHKYPVNASTTGLGAFSNCQIKVTSTGPISGPISISENLTSTGSGAVLTALTGAGWTCPPTPINAPATVTCTKPAPAFASAGTNIINATVQMPATDNGLAKNCAAVVNNGVAGKPSCDTIVVDPPHDSSRDISKVCEPTTEVVGAINSYVSKCHITLTTTGPQTGTITLTDGFTGVGSLSNATAPAPWTCAGSGCSVNGSALNQTSSSSVMDVTVTFNNKGNVLEARNCATISSETGKESCTGFTVGGGNADMYVKKVVVNHAPLPLTGMVYDITSQCSDNTIPTGFAHFTDGMSVLFHHYKAGVTCSLSEVIPPTTACGNDTPVWTTTYAPSQTVALQPNGEMVTVTNTLDCKPAIVIGGGNSELAVEKEAIYNGRHITNIAFPMNVTCGKGNAQSINVTDGTPSLISNLAIGTSCSVQEGSIPTTGLCPQGQTEQWATTYSPSATAVTTANTTAVVRVRNELTCVPPTDGRLNFKKVVVNHSPGSLAGMIYRVSITCSRLDTFDANLLDGVRNDLNGLQSGATCSFLEKPIPPTTACGNDTPVWTTSYSPAQTVTHTSAGELVTITNQLDCQPASRPILTEPPAKTQIPPIVIIPPVSTQLICDAATAQFVNGTCRCTIEGQVPVSKTACACPNGQQLVNGRCQTPPPKCDGNTHFDPAVGKCVPNRIECTGNTHLDPNSGKCVNNAPICKDGTHLSPDGLRCVPNQVDCPAGTHHVLGNNRCEKDRPTCQDGQQYDPRRNACFTPKPVCGRGTHLDAASNACVPNPIVCGRGQKLNPDSNKCERVKPDCQAPMVYNPRNNSCVKVDQPCPRGTIKLRGACIPIPKIQIPLPGRTPQGAGPKAQTPRGGNFGLPGINLGL